MLLTRLHIAVAVQRGHLAPPDPFHTGRIALSGGLALGALWLGASAAIAATRQREFDLALWVLPLGALGVGLWDDLAPLRPLPKILAQAGLGVLAIGAGFLLLPEPAWWALNVPLTLLWIVGLANAFNLLDNMDGVLTGVSIPIFAAIALLSMVGGDWQAAVAAVVVAGGCLGFLWFNRLPGKVFLGDCGSMFLGYTAALLIARVAGHVADGPWVVVPGAAILAGMPVYNTTFITLARPLAGVPLSLGKADHINYRLVSLGASVPRTVSLTWLGSLTSVAVGTATLVLPSRFGLAIAGLYCVFLTYLAIALYRGKTEQWAVQLHVPRRGAQLSPAAELIWKLAPGFVAILDAALSGVTVVGAVALRFDGHVSSATLTAIMQVWPYVAILRILTLWFVGKVYEHTWWHALLADYLRLALALFLSGVVIGGFLLLVGLPEALPPSTLVLEPILALVVFGFARAVPRIVREWLYIQADAAGRRRALVVGAGEAASLLLREARANPRLRLSIVGFVDDGKQMLSGRIGNVPVLGPVSHIGALCPLHRIDEVIISTDKIPDDAVLPQLLTLQSPPRVSRFRVSLQGIALERGPSEGELTELLAAPGSLRSGRPSRL